MRPLLRLFVVLILTFARVASTLHALICKHNPFFKLSRFILLWWVVGNNCVFFIVYVDLQISDVSVGCRLIKINRSGSLEMCNRRAEILMPSFSNAWPYS